MISVMTIYVSAVGLGVLLWDPVNTPQTSSYQLYKDLMPLIIAIPAAYLAFAFQRRSSSLQALRSVWHHAVAGISAALRYTDTPMPTQEQHLEMLEKLSATIEEVRGVYKNVPAKGAPEGWYPFEPIKQIYQELRDLGFGGDATPAKRTVAREHIYAMWKPSRARLLAEFDRDRPTYHHAEYAAIGPRHGATAPVGNS